MLFGLDSSHCINETLNQHERARLKKLCHKKPNQMKTREVKFRVEWKKQEMGSETDFR